MDDILKLVFDESGKVGKPPAPLTKTVDPKKALQVKMLQVEDSESDDDAIHGAASSIVASGCASAE